MGGRATIVGLGYYVPERVLTNFDLEKMVDTSDEWIRTRTGIVERRILDDRESTATMATVAAQRALESAGVEPSDVDLVIVATCTPDHLFPATACLVQEAIGADRAGAFDLEAACSGFIYGVSTAAQFVQTGAYRTVLLVTSEALTRFVDWQDRSTCVLFGDGAAAAVIRAEGGSGGLLSFSLRASGAGGDLLKLPAGGSRMPASYDTVDGRLHYIKMAGSEVFKFAVKAMYDASLEVLAKAELTPADVDLLIPHQANLRIIQAVGKRLELPEEKVFVNIDRYGNTSAASIPIALAEALDSGRVHVGDHLVFVAFGGGLTWAAAVMQWTHDFAPVGGSRYRGDG